MPNMTNGFECVLFFVIFALEPRLPFSDFPNNKLHRLMITFWKCPSPRFYGTRQKMVHFNVFCPKGPRRARAPNLMAIQENVNKKKIISMKTAFLLSFNGHFLRGGEGPGCVVW